MWFFLRINLFRSTNLYASLRFSVFQSRWPNGKTDKKVWSLCWKLSSWSCSWSWFDIDCLISNLLAICVLRLQTCISWYFTVNESVAISRKNLPARNIPPSNRLVVFSLVMRMSTSNSLVWVPSQTIWSTQWAFTCFKRKRPPSRSTLEKTSRHTSTVCYAD